MKSYPPEGRVRLRLNLADSALVAPLKQGRIASDLIDFDFSGPKVAHDGFKPMVREEAFDAGELAIVTFMQARAAGLPWTMLPATMVGRFQHHCIGYAAQRGALRPRDIEGRRVGVRSYSQTTGMWVRGILAHEYEVDLSRVTWCAHDDPHVAQSPDPQFVQRFRLDGRKLAELMLDGTFVAAILGNDFPRDDGAAHLIPDPHSAALDWYARERTIPVNHVFVVHSALAQQRPDIVVELYRLLSESKAAAGIESEIDMLPFGRAALDKSLRLASLFAFEQGLLPRRLEPSELIDVDLARLGD